MNLGHVLIFGGTGMLKEASRWISTHAEHTIIFGRNRDHLASIKENFGNEQLEVRELDYTDIISLENELKRAFITNGPIHMVVAWIHGTAPSAIPTIIEQIDQLQENLQWNLILIKGSSDNLSSITTPILSTRENCIIKEVKLGFIYDGNSSRWLTHQEISSGTIQAIIENKHSKIIGTLEPWDKRP
ncbi:hypothetical protein SPD48_08450 [Pseudogracilibacillus sp. SE30717A]|uniref:hypothetical protein n=1 Tax=Pseudogracilibacillus sp. SE30717A TaxID=3098293 RepID=UPI00300E0D39